LSSKTHKQFKEHYFIFLAPAKIKRIEFEFANGIDNIIEERDKDENKDNVCKIVLINERNKDE